MHGKQLFLGKFEPPHLNQNVVNRTSLYSGVSNFPDEHLTLVVAPAGYGKTTLLVQWYYSLKTTGIRAGWLSLDENEDDAVEFTRHLLFAALEGGVPFGELTPMMQTGAQNLTPRSGAATLLSKIKLFQRPFVLFIDDYHKVKSAECLDVLSYLIDWAPDNFRLVTATRIRPALDLASLKLENKLSIIDTDDLRFSLHDCIQFLGNDFAESDMQSLVLQTEGWPVALRLLQTSKNISGNAGVETIIGPKIDLTFYLEEQIFSRLDDIEQDFLMMTSLPNRFNGEIANVLMQRTDGWEILDRLEQRSLLIVPLDSRRRWFRYHDLFREFLKDRLRRKKGEKVESLHTLMADWLVQKGYYADALSHCLENHNYTFAAEVLEKAGGWRVGLRGGMSILHKAKQIPEDVIKDYPLARLALIYHHMQTSNVRLARKHYELLRADTDNFRTQGGQELGAAIRNDCRIVECAIRLYEDIVIRSDFVEKINQELDRQQEVDPLIRTLIDKNFAMFAYYDGGKYEQCIKIGTEAIREFGKQEALYALNYVNLYVGLAYTHLGQFHDAKNYFRHAIDYASKFFPFDYHILAGQLFLGLIDLENNYLNKSLHTFESVVRQLPRDIDGWIPCYEVGFCGLANTFAAIGDKDQALETIDDAQNFSESSRFHRLWMTLEILRADLAVQFGDIDGAEGILDSKRARQLLEGRTESPHYSLRAHEHAIIVKARLLFAGAEYESVADQLAQIDALTEGNARPWIEIKAHVLRGAAALALGDTDEAFAALDRSLELAEKAELIKSLLDETPLIRKQCSSGAGGASEKSFAKFLGALDKFERRYSSRKTSAFGEQQASAFSSSEIIEKLAPRERDVLDMLVLGMSNKEIARNLSLAESTIKSYRKTLYKKLQVVRRSQVIEKARELGLA